MRSQLIAVYCLIFFFLATRKNDVYPTVKVGRGNQNLDFEIRRVCPESPSFDLVEFHLRESCVKLSVTNFMLDISVALDERLYTENKMFYDFR